MQYQKRSRCLTLQTSRHYNLLEKNEKHHWNQPMCYFCRNFVSAKIFHARRIDIQSLPRRPSSTTKLLAWKDTSHITSPKFEGYFLGWISLIGIYIYICQGASSEVKLRHAKNCQPMHSLGNKWGDPRIQSLTFFFMGDKNHPKKLPLAGGIFFRSSSTRYQCYCWRHQEFMVRPFQATLRNPLAAQAALFDSTSKSEDKAGRQPTHQNPGIVRFGRQVSPPSSRFPYLKMQDIILKNNQLKCLKNTAAHPYSWSKLHSLLWTKAEKSKPCSGNTMPWSPCTQSPIDQPSPLPGLRRIQAG